MTYTATKERENFKDAVINEIQPHISDLPTIKRILKSIMSNGATHARLCSTECNRELTDSETAKMETIESRLAFNLQDLNRYITDVDKIKMLLSGDPRGFTVKLLLPRTNKFNTWGGAECGYGVPTS